jgi:2-oxoglutarate dehydrogenase E2 component (dihydrolipoamide succinyltransferase)
MAGMDSADDVTLVPHSRIRRRIAQHMVASNAVSAHAYALIDVDYFAVDKVRRECNDEWKQTYGYSLTYLPFVARAVVLGIAQYRKLNSRYTETGLEVRRETGLGIAVDMNFEGLVVPVIPGADQLTVPQLADAIHDLADRTRREELRSSDVSGGTFTLSNPGPFGARMTLPIINQPQVAILTVDAIAPRPAVGSDSEGSPSLTIRPIGNLTLAWDHRAFDGAYAASALNAIRTALESHDWQSEFDFQLQGLEPTKGLR